MEKRYLRNLEVSSVGMGCMDMGKFLMKHKVSKPFA